ncbi:hypothetical protein IJ818_06765 [bacterium]|nr:hypothetical protein [bacterium]
MSNSFGSITKFKRMASNYTINRTGTVNNNQKINSSNGTNNASSVQLSMVTEDVASYEVVEVNDAEAKAKESALQEQLKKGYSQEMIDAYFTYDSKKQKYNLKDGYSICKVSELKDVAIQSATGMNSGMNLLLNKNSYYSKSNFGFGNNVPKANPKYDIMAYLQKQFDTDCKDGFIVYKKSDMGNLAVGLFGIDSDGTKKWGDEDNKKNKEALVDINMILNGYLSSNASLRSYNYGLATTNFSYDNWMMDKSRISYMLTNENKLLNA